MLLRWLGVCGSLVALGVAGEAGGCVLQLGAAYHCGVGIPTAQLHFAAGCCVSLWSW